MAALLKYVICTAREDCVHIENQLCVTKIINNKIHFVDGDLSYPKKLRTH